MSIICKLPNGNYLLWSTITDSPVTYGCPLPELEAFLAQECGREYMKNDHPRRMARVEQYGTSWTMSKASFEDIANFNRAGPGEMRLTIDEILEHYSAVPDGKTITVFEPVQDNPTPPRPMHIFAQTEIIRGLDTIEALEALQNTPGNSGTRLTMFSGQNAKDLMSRENERLKATGMRPVVFCSLQVAGHIKRECPQMAQGLILPRDFLQHETYSTVITPDLLLNPKGLYLPWGRILMQREMIEAAVGRDIFLRPSSPMKPFTGFRVNMDNLEAEIRAHAQTEAISPEEMTFIAPGLDLPQTEYRVWVIDGQAVSTAGYSWDNIGAHQGSTPDAVLQAAARIAQETEWRENCFTADFVMIDGAPKLVELNAISTSGWYPGISPLSVFRALDAILV